MRRIRRILVRIQNPTAPSLPAVTKAAQLARALDGDLTLVQTLPTPFDPDDELPTRHQQRGALRNYARGAHEACFKAISLGLRRRGIRVTISVNWDHPTDNALLDMAGVLRADLIVIDALPRDPADPTLSLADWALLRHSPFPVLLVKRPAAYRRPRILLALDPTCTSPKTRLQDAAVVSVGSALSHALHGSLHAVTAYKSRPPQSSSEAPLSAAVLAPRSTHSTGRKRVDHAATGPVAHVATDIRSALVVMGAPQEHWPGTGSCTGAPRLIQRLTCDILLVAPAPLSPRQPAPGGLVQVDRHPQPATLVSA